MGSRKVVTVSDFAACILALKEAFEEMNNSDVGNAEKSEWRKQLKRASRCVESAIEILLGIPEDYRNQEWWVRYKTCCCVDAILSPYGQMRLTEAILGCGRPLLLEEAIEAIFGHYSQQAMRLCQREILCEALELPVKWTM
jgi:hypothetical protein